MRLCALRQENQASDAGSILSTWKVQSVAVAVAAALRLLLVLTESVVQ